MMGAGFSGGPTTTLSEMIAQAFGGPDAPFSLWSDSQRLVSLFNERGVPSHHFSEIADGQTILGNVVLAPVTIPDQGESAIFRKHFDAASALVIPLRSFGTEIRELEYLPRALALIDFRAAADGVRRAVDQLSISPNGLQLSSPSGTDITVTLGDDVQLMTPKGTNEFLPGEWVSIAQFLEVGIVPQAAKNSFSLTGRMIADGLSIAHHVLDPDLSVPASTAAWRRAMRLREHDLFPLVVEIEDNSCTGIRDSRGRSIEQELLQHTDPALRGELIELAMSTVNLPERPDWSINSQINEAWGGAHMAFGMGLKGAHIDFVGTDIEIGTW